MPAGKIIGLDKNYALERICGSDPEKKFSLLLDHTDRPGDVSDPWYTDRFDIAYDDIYKGCVALLEKLL